MPSNRTSGRKARECGSKAPYPSEAEAKLAAKRTEREQRLKLYTYRCNYCESWHLTRQSPINWWDTIRK